MKQSPSAVASRALYALSDTEWQRYQTLMQGPHGQWSASLHPLFVLGLEAATPAERDHFAERYAEIVFTRVQKAAAFAAAYQEAYQRRYGTVAGTLFARADKRAMSSMDRLALFARHDCPACDDKLEEVLFALDRGDAAGLDIYLTDAADDDAIRAWAAARDIPIDDVKAARITLNHAGTELETVGLADAALPVVLKASPPGTVPPLPLRALFGAPAR